jgi:hypothetical protein
MTNKEKLEHDARLLAKCEEWLKDGDTWLGVFENHDFGHPDMGRKAIFPFPLSDVSWEVAKEGETRAPDGKSIGFGWRYILILKTKDAKQAVRALIGEVENA